MKLAIIHSCLVTTAACAALHAAEVAIPAAPPPAFADTESVTNAPLGAALARARFLRVELSLDATPSNNVEIVFGKAGDGGNAHASGEEEFSVGWDCGAWFIASPTNRITSGACEGTARRNLFLEVRVAEDGTPRKWTVTPSGGVFADLPSSPPSWAFSRDWTAVRLTVRGVDERAESVSVRIGTDPGVIMLR